MGQVIQRINSILSSFLGKFLGLESGSFQLTTGNHIIEIPLEEDPYQVWVRFEGDKFDGCGQPVINRLGYTLGCKSLVFDVEVKAATVDVHWFTIYG